ncbi:EamA family transporter [Rhodobacteraceae bacterium NNCM2]|nr:EamA family transporter [Coraliihabitans acroporae]
MTQRMDFAQRRAEGVALVAVSALIWSTAGIFTKGVSADAWSIIFWRGVAAAAFTLVYLAFRGRLIREAREMGWPGALVAILSALGTAAFIPAFKLTSVANVALIYAAAPFLAAGLAWIALRERPAGAVIAASLAAFAGVGLIVSGSTGGGSLWGDMLALWMTLMMAGTMVVFRRWPQTPAALPAALSCLLLLPPAMMFAEPFETAGSEMPAIVTFGLVFAVASVMLSEGARRLPSAETALLSALETPFGPLLAWLILAENPGPMTVIGGAVVLMAVFGAQAWQMRPRAA